MANSQEVWSALQDLVASMLCSVDVSSLVTLVCPDTLLLAGQCSYFPCASLLFSLGL